MLFNMLSSDVVMSPLILLKTFPLLKVMESIWVLRCLSHSYTLALCEVRARWCQSELVSLAFELSVMAHWPEGHLSSSPRLHTLMLLL